MNNGATIPIPILDDAVGFCDTYKVKVRQRVLQGDNGNLYDFCEQGGDTYRSPLLREYLIKQEH